jgi:hypothetical protein
LPLARLQYLLNYGRNRHIARNLASALIASWHITYLTLPGQLVKFSGQ